VRIVDFAFEPATLTVPVGTTVIWRNTGVQHTVLTLTGSVRIASDVLEGGDAFSFTFAQSGTFPYVCGLHPDMEGTIVVR